MYFYFGLFFANWLLADWSFLQVKKNRLQKLQEKPIKTGKKCLYVCLHYEVPFESILLFFQNDIAQQVTEFLMEKAEMLDDYFSMEINDKGELVSLPQLMDDFVPYFGSMPSFVMRLATEVNWIEEEACFDTFSRYFLLC